MELLIQALVQGVLLGVTYGLVALGANVIYSVSGVVNFARSASCLRSTVFLALWTSVKRPTVASCVANPDSSTCLPPADRYRTLYAWGHFDHRDRACSQSLKNDLIPQTNEPKGMTCCPSRPMLTVC